MFKYIEYFTILIILINLFDLNYILQIEKNKNCWVKHLVNHKVSNQLTFDFTIHLFFFVTLLQQKTDSVLFFTLHVFMFTIIKAYNLYIKTTHCIFYTLQFLLLLNLFNQSFLLLILTLEIVTIFLYFYLFSDNEVSLFLKKKTILFFLTVNVLTSLPLLISYFFLNINYKTTNFLELSFLSNTFFTKQLFILLVISLFIKSGFLIGNKFLNSLYDSLPKQFSFIYLLYVYFIVPFVIYPLLNLIHFSTIDIFVMLFIVIFFSIQNLFFVNNTNTILLVSNQFSLFYFFMNSI